MTLPTEQQVAIQLPDSFSMRAATLDDIPAVVALLNACSQALYGKDEFSIDDTRMNWSDPHFDLATSTRVVLTPPGHIVGMIEVWDEEEPPVHPRVWSRVHPDYTGQGIGTALRVWAEARLDGVVERCPAGTKVSYLSYIHEGQDKAQALFESFGMQPIRHHWHMLIEMDAAPLEPQFPPGVRVRTYRHDADFVELIKAESDAFQDHFGYVVQPLDKQLEMWRHFIDSDDKFDESLWFLAIDEASGEIAGMSLARFESWHDDTQGWVNSLGVRRAWRNQGLGLALLQHTFAEFWRRGQKRVGLGVDASSLTGATRLYQKAGMHVVRRFTSYEKVLRDGEELATTELES